MHNNGNHLIKTHQRKWHWLTLIAILLGIMTAGLSSLGTSSAWAYQDEPAAEAPAEPVAEEAVEEGTEEEADGGAPVKESFLSWMIRASGFFGFILLLLSFVMVALIAGTVAMVVRISVVIVRVVAVTATLESLEHSEINKKL